MSERPTPFLRQVVRQYIANETDRLDKYCFIVPNKRTATFLAHYFNSEIENYNSSLGSEDSDNNRRCALILPEIMTISDLVSDFSEQVEASQFELLFIIYNVYADILNERATPEMREAGAHLVDFNMFQSWGNVLVNDFNDVDKYLVDAKQLFRNVESLKEISANYLTPEQIEVLKRYWNESDIPQPAKDFWNHVTYRSGREIDKKKSAGSFIRLWQIMYDIYLEYGRRLDKLNMTYSGRMYRRACDILADMSADDLEYERYIFVGFNVLSASEIRIFKEYKRMGVGDFYWDYGSPAFGRVANSATRFLKQQIKEFGSRYEAGETFDYFPEVEIIPMPTAIGQIKMTPAIIRQLHPELFDEHGRVDYDVSQQSLFNTAVVLPDEKLCLPLLQALPTDINSVNVTMGLSIREAPVSSLIRSIVSMQLRARMLKYDNTFYFEDVLSVLSNPLIANRFGDECAKISLMINSRHLFNIPVSELDNDEYASLKPIFRVVSNNNNADAVIGYLYDLVVWLYDLAIERREEIKRLTHDSPQTVINGIDDFETAPSGLELGFLQAYCDALVELRRLEDKYLRPGNVFMADRTVFHLVERLIGHKVVAFEGMPLEGLQIMGVLETRNLDFENVILMSMNERIFPRRHYSKSMIPNALRRAYGMATIDHQESIYAYYFYRMISRARRVVLMYDGRNKGTRSGQPSRYINQVKFTFPPGRVRFAPMQYPMNTIKTIPDGIVKTKRIMDILNLYRKEKNGRTLSASALNTYINCPLAFYLNYVEKYYQPDEFSDDLDDSTYGKIVHDTLQSIYEEQRHRLGIADNHPMVVTEELIDIMSRENNLMRHLERAIRHNHLHRDPDTDTTPLKGDSQIIQTVLLYLLQHLFRQERKRLPFSFLYSEVDESIRLKVSDAITINLYFRIDRVDVETDDTGEQFIRIIDYKTGSDATDCKGIESLFSRETEHRDKAVFQLLLYSKAYADKHGFDGRIHPMIYQLRKVAKEGLKNLSMPNEIAGKRRVPLTDYREVEDEFKSRLQRLLEELFNPEIPFRSYPSDDHCKYCQFADICNIKTK